MSPRAPLLGAVLTGGRGARYGAPKARVLVGGEPMVRRVASALAPVVEDLVVVSPRPEPAAPELRRVADRVPGRGPLGGLHAALHDAKGLGLGGVLLVGCDLPLVTTELLTVVASALPGAAAAAPELHGRIEAVCAAWSVGVLPEVERRLEGDDLSLQALFRAVAGVRVEPGPEGSWGVELTNVNTPGDRERAEAALVDARAGGSRPS